MDTLRPEPSASKASKVLIVDDEAILAMEMEMIVGEGGYRPVGPAATVESALGLIDSDTPDLALLDVTLARGDSTAIADRLAELGIPFAFLTGHRPDSIPAAHRDRPVLGKPFGAQDIHDMLACLAR